jgi:ABC-type multidrug transport system fused ATPase/permease subunit
VTRAFLRRAEPDDEPAAEEAAAPRRVRLRDLLRVTRGNRRTIGLGLGLALTGAGLGLAQPIVALQTIEAAGHGQRIAGKVALLVVLFLGQAATDTGGRYLLERAGEGMVLRLRVGLIGRLVRIALPAYERSRLGDLMSRVTTDTTLLRDVIAYDIVDLTTGVFVVLGGAVMMILLDPVLFGLVVLTVSLAGLAVAAVLTGIRTATERAQESIGEMAADLERALGALRTVRAARAEDRESERIAQRARAAYAANVRAAKLDSIAAPAIELAVHGSLIVALVVGGMRVADHRISLGDLVAFLLYVTYVAPPLADLFGIVGTLQRGLAALQRVEDGMALPTEDTGTPPDGRGPGPAPTPAGPDRGPAALELRDVHFAYGDRDVLHGVSFQVPPRSHVALVGPSGAGKSTIFSLVERFYEPHAGAILLDGRDLHRDITAHEARGRIGLVEQDSPVLYGTLRENLCYANPDASDADLRRVVALASLSDLVSRLPAGLDTQVGEHGVLLSGGERQRIAIARALLTRPSLLLLDEPTSALDAANEAALARAIEGARSECAVLVITHRESTLRAADGVVVLDGGRVVTDAAATPGGRSLPT